MTVCDGSVKNIDNNTTDIPRLKEEIARLTREKEMYHSVFENTGTGTIIIDSEMLIHFVNARFESLTGYNRADIENRMKWSEFVTPEDNKKMQYYHYGRRKGVPDIPTEYECRIWNKAGDIKYIYMKVGMIPGTGMSIASFMDITQRKHAEERLRESESQLSAIIQTFEGLIYIASADYKIGFMNTTLVKRTGNDAMGETCHRAVHGLDAPCPWCKIRNVFQGETARHEEKSPKDGRWYSSIQSPIYDANGRITQIQTILIDITERKQKEEKISENANYLRNENIILRSAMKERYKFGDIVGKSRVMQNVYELILRASSSSAHVIVYGESGTGKELVARAIHNLSDRSHKRFVPVNCGAIHENVIESEFFGYKKGAFTGADKDKQGFLDVADGGTLFLDEVGDIGLNIQVKLLRAIEGGGYTPVGGNTLKKPNLRIIAATNKNLKSLVTKGLMREDFFYRVHIIPIKLPPLRERKEDLPLLIDHFLSGYGDNEKIPPMNATIMDAFSKHEWPGNVRELQNTLHRFITLNEIDFIDNLPGAMPRERDFSDLPAPVETDGNLTETLAHIEKTIIAKALEENRWLKTKTAAALGIHRKTLFTKMKKYGLT